MDTKHRWRRNHGRNDGPQDSRLIHLRRGRNEGPQTAAEYRGVYDETNLQNQGRRMRFRLRLLYDVELTESLNRNTGV